MSDRKCPDCGERLSMDAMRCACGWGAKRAEKGQRFFDHRCTYAAGQERCRYPVGMFTEGNISGWCIFHRRNLSQADGMQVVMDSNRIPYEQAIRPIMESAARSPTVRDCAWDIAKHHGDKPWQAGMDQLLAAARRAA